MNIENHYVQLFFDFVEKTEDRKLLQLATGGIEHIGIVVEITAITGIGEDVIDFAEITATFHQNCCHLWGPVQTKNTEKKGIKKKMMKKEKDKELRASFLNQPYKLKQGQFLP